LKAEGGFEMEEEEVLVRWRGLIDLMSLSMADADALDGGAGGQAATC
jgi:hypothetical protein